VDPQKDFRAPFRVLAGIQDGFNRKGVIDPSGRHKLAFDVVRSWNLSKR
jgi:beta-glucuronidase